jgi:hypothetical protein
MPDDEVPLTTRGVPRTRFDPLRDAPKPPSDGSIGKLAELDDAIGIMEQVEVQPPVDLISVVRRQIRALGLLESVEGQAAIVAAEKAVDATGSAAAACLHELRMAMNEIRSSKPVGEVKNATEDVLSRRRERKSTG